MTESPSIGPALGEGETAIAAILLALVAGILLGRTSRAAAVRRGLAASRLIRRRSPEPVACEALPASDSEAPLALGEFWDATATCFCPVCRAEYLAGTAVCEDCGVELVEEDEVPEAEVNIQEGVLRVARVANSLHGQLVRQFLAANRIPCSIQRCTPWDLFGSDIYVFESDALRAKKLIRHFLAELNVSTAA